MSTLHIIHDDRAASASISASSTAGTIVGSEFRTAETGASARLYASGAESHRLLISDGTLNNVVQIAPPGMGASVFQSLLPNYEVLQVNGNTTFGVRTFNVRSQGEGEAILVEGKGGGIRIQFGTPGVYTATAGLWIQGSGTGGQGFVVGPSGATSTTNWVAASLSGGSEGVGASIRNTSTTKANPDLIIGDANNSIGGVIKIKKRTTFPPYQDELLMNHATHGLCGCNGSQWIRILDGVVVG